MVVSILFFLALQFSNVLTFDAFRPSSSIAYAVPRTADTIYWQELRRLTWDDFRGKPVKSDESVALTSSGIGMAFRSGANGVPVINITCTFFCNNSWVKDEGRNPDVLQHEQLHFDLTELYARKLRQAVSKLSAKDRTWPTVSKIYQDLNRECNQRQNAYDKETEHGIKASIQKTWNGQIEAELALLDEFKSGA